MRRARTCLTGTLTLLVGASVFLSVLLPTSAGADPIDPNKPIVKLQVAPATVTKTLVPGATIEDKFYVLNSGNTDFTFETYPSPVSVTDENYDISYSDPNPANQMSKWITIQSGYNNTLKPGEKTIVNYKIEVPNPLPALAQMAVIMVETDARAPENQRERINSRQRIALPISADLGASNNNVAGQFVDSRFPWVSLKSEDIDTSFVAKNTGNTNFYTSGVLYKKSLWDFIVKNDDKDVDTGDNKVDFVISDKELIYPGTARLIHLKWERPPFFGLYYMTHDVNVAGNTHIAGQWIFICPWWLLILFGILLLAFIVWRIRKHSKREKHHDRIERLEKKLLELKRASGEGSTRDASVTSDPRHPNGDSDPKLDPDTTPTEEIPVVNLTKYV